MTMLKECTKGPWPQCAIDVASLFSTAKDRETNAALIAAAFDHALIGWAVFMGLIEIACNARTNDATIRSVDLNIDLQWVPLDPFGFPVLTDDLRTRLIREMETAP